MKRTLIAVAMLIGILAPATVLASPAPAHTPDISASCQGVVLKADSYEGNKSNKWTVTVDGKTDSGTFGSSLNKVIPVPQNGKTTSWSATIQAEDGGFKQSKSGSVGPCGEPADDTESKKVTLCHATGSESNPFTKITVSVAAFFNSGHVDHSGDIYEGFTYTKKGDTQTVAAKGDTSLLQYDDCKKPVVVPPKPHKDQTTEVKETLVCDTEKVNIVTTYTTYDYTLDKDKNEWIESTSTREVKSDRWATDAELKTCPPPVVPPQPPALVRTEVDEDLVCDTKLVEYYTYTWTTPFVYEPIGNQWVEGEEVLTTAPTGTRPATPEELADAECEEVVTPPVPPVVTPPVVTPPVPPVVTPPVVVTPPKVDAPKDKGEIATPISEETERSYTDQSAVLPATGGPSIAIIIIGSLLLLVGLALIGAATSKVNAKRNL